MAASRVEVLGKKVVTTIDGVKRLIISEVLKSEFSRASGGARLEALALYFEGTMGIGKSQAVRQAAAFLSKLLGEEFGIRDIRLAGMTGSDIQGIPVPVNLNGETLLKWLKDTLLPGVSKDCPKHGILFLDELNQVEDNSVRSLLYQLILDRKINDYTIPDGWYIVAAGNREEDGGVYNRLPAPVRDRMMIVEVALNAQEWLDMYARPYKVHPAVVSFIEGHKEFLHTYDPEKENEGDEECENYVFATPRSWVMISDQIYAYEDPDINRRIAMDSYGQLITEELLKTQIGSLSGDDLGSKFYAYYMQTRDCRLEEIYAINWSNGRPNREIALTADQLVYLANIAAYPTDEEIEHSIKIVLYLVACGSTGANISMILNSYTEAQSKVLYDFCIVNKCPTYITQLEEYTSKLRNIRNSSN